MFVKIVRAERTTVLCQVLSIKIGRQDFTTVNVPSIIYSRASVARRSPTLMELSHLFPCGHQS